MTVDRRALHLELADRVCRAAEGLIASASNQHARQPDTRSDVLSALALKMDGAFRALVEDCRAGRAEAMHHLKTMAEAFIYFHVVAKDAGQRTAERILADAVGEEHLKRLAKIGGDPEEVRGWTEFRDDFRHEAARLSHLETLAQEHSEELHGWYGWVYRLACQSSHIGDLLLWMPDEREIRIGPKAADAQASSAIHYGLYIALLLLDTINAITQAELRVPTEDLWRSLKAIQAGDQVQERL